MGLLFLWLMFGVVSAVVAQNKGRNGCGWFAIGVLLGPFGFILALVASKIERTTIVSPEAMELVKSGDARVLSGDYEGALADYGQILALQPKAPTTHFKIAAIYSIKRMHQESFSHLSKAVKHGFIDFNRIMSDKDFSFLRAHPDFQTFAQNGYVFAQPATPKDDTIPQLEKLAKLKENGMITEKEFEEQKRKLLA